MKRLFSFSNTIRTTESSRGSDRWLLRLLLVAIIGALVWVILSINAALSVSDVRAGGELREGIVGTPRFVNPVLARTRADQDVTQLVYSGLLRVAADNTLDGDLAENWTISEDGTVYTVVLRDDAAFHDDVPVTATDVVYTIGLIQNQDLFVVPALRTSWSGVTVTAVDDRTVEITLSEPYAPFIQNLTLGILPAHIWRGIPVDQIPFAPENTSPVGSGPYQVADVEFNKGGTVSRYQLEPAATHVPPALLSQIELHFYTNDAALVEAWDDGDIDSSAYLPAAVVADLAPDSHHIVEVPLTRTFGLFFNQNRSEVLRDAAVREALELAVDRGAIVHASLGGAGIPSTVAVKTTNGALELADGDSNELSDQDTGKELATQVLEDAGWNKTSDGWELTTDAETITLSVTIRTENTPVLDATLRSVVAAWEDLGVVVATEQFTQTDLKQTVIRNREFDILLYGIDTGRAGDLYQFWHSSQQDDPGLNVSQYANLTVDDHLEELRTTTDPAQRESAMASINTIIQSERPVIFLFQPTVQYVTSADVTASLPRRLSLPSDRFAPVATWYAHERTLWPIFTKPDDATETILDTTNNQSNN